MTIVKLEERRAFLKQQLTFLAQQHTIVSGQLAEVEYLINDENKSEQENTDE